MSPAPRKVGPTHDDYATQVGSDALDRQRAEAEIRFDCCGEMRDDGHHPMCRKAERAEEYPVIDGQETLL